jgi:hypothetical protein
VTRFADRDPLRLQEQQWQYNKVKYETLLYHAFPDIFEEFTETNKTPREEQRP